MSVSTAHPEQQHWSDAPEPTEPLTIDRPVGTRVVVATDSEEEFTAEVSSGGVVCETGSEDPIPDADHEVLRTKSAFNRAGDWHYNERDESGDVLPEDDDQVAGHAELDGTPKWDWVAHGVLKDNAPSLCPVAMSAFDQEMDLGDAYAFPPRSDNQMDVDYEFRFEPRPYRVNEEYGWIPSGPIVGNRPIQEFQLDIWAVLEGATLLWENTRKREQGIGYETAGEIWDEAMRLKRSGGPHDVTIMAKVARWISNPRLLESEE